MYELVVVGGGKMGAALVGGLVRAGWAGPGALAVVEQDRGRREALATELPGVDIVDAVVPGRGVVLAVKPQQVVDVCRGLDGLGVARVLSIAAGVPLDDLDGAVPDGVAVVRAMPNTPALVGRAASAITGGETATEDDLVWAESVLGAVGTVVRVTEPQLDAVTGLSGSGPAYVFLVAEALIDAGVEQGLPRDVASALAVQTLRGAAELLATGQAPAELRAAVTSPGGTTAAGLRALEANGVRSAFADAVDAAVTRSRDLR